MTQDFIPWYIVADESTGDRPVYGCRMYYIGHDAMHTYYTSDITKAPQFRTYEATEAFMQRSRL